MERARLPDVLTKRIIPCLDVQNGRVVKNVRFFENHRDAGDPLALAQLYEAQQADELVFYDITATHEGRSLMLDVAARVAEQVMMPLTVGGGVNAVSDFRQLLMAGPTRSASTAARCGGPNSSARRPTTSARSAWS